jgi:hypothetical protein
VDEKFSSWKYDFLVLRIGRMDYEVTHIIWVDESPVVYSDLSGCLYHL